MGKFNLNADTRGRGNFLIWKGTVADSKISDACGRGLKQTYES